MAAPLCMACRTLQCGPWLQVRVPPRPPETMPISAAAQQKMLATTVVPLFANMHLTEQVQHVQQDQMAASNRVCTQLFTFGSVATVMGWCQCKESRRPSPFLHLLHLDNPRLDVVKQSFNGCIVACLLHWCQRKDTARS